MATLENIANKYPDEQMYKRVFFYELALKHVEYILIHGHLAHPDGMQKRFLVYHKLLKDINPDHVIPTEIPASLSSGACYIATSVYGSYNCPQVWTLRRFRDNTLAESWYGRTFIRIYYAISPTLLKWFGKSKWFTKLWKLILDCLIANLNKNGISDMPYDDRVW